MLSPKLVILFKNGSIAIENEVEPINLAEKVGFSMLVLRPDWTTKLAKFY